MTMLSAMESNRFFPQVREQFPDKAADWASGYVHGVSDSTSRRQPRAVMVKDAAGGDEYALGYLAGFFDHAGLDVVEESWVMRHGLTCHFRWWEAQEE